MGSAPGGPQSRTPFGMRAPLLRNSLGLVKKSTTSWSSTYSTERALSEPRPQLYPRPRMTGLVNICNIYGAILPDGADTLPWASFSCAHAVQQSLAIHNPPALCKHVN